MYAKGAYCILELPNGGHRSNGGICYVTRGARHLKVTSLLEAGDTPHNSPFTDPYLSISGHTEREKYGV